MKYYFDNVNKTTVVIDGELAKDAVYEEYFHLPKKQLYNHVNEAKFVQISPVSFEKLTRNLRIFFGLENPLQLTQPALKEINEELTNYGL